VTQIPSSPPPASNPAAPKPQDVPYWAPSPGVPLNGGPDPRDPVNEALWRNPHFGSIDPLHLPLVTDPKRGNRSTYFKLNDGTNAPTAPVTVCVRQVQPGLDYAKVLGPFVAQVGSKSGLHHAKLVQAAAMICADGSGPLAKKDKTGAPQTALAFGTQPATYPDPSQFPYVVLPQAFYRTHSDVKQGDLVAVLYKGRVTYAVAGDQGDGNHFGEVSVKVARELAIPSDPNNGGVPNGVTYVFFPGSGFGNPADPAKCTPANIAAVGAALFAAAGGKPTL